MQSEGHSTKDLVSPQRTDSKARALVVSSMYTEAETAQRIGREAYSYRFVYRALAPLLERWGRTSEITWHGNRTTMYHYVATADFPYLVSCYRGTPV